MSPRKNYTPAERALHLIGALAGKTAEEINEAIESGDSAKHVPNTRRKMLPEASLKMLKRQYILATIPTEALVTVYWGAMWEHCVAPKKLGDL